MTQRRLDAAALAAAFAVPAAVYVASASWEPGSWDTAELQGVPYILGIAHPTGFPLYVMLGYLWSHALPVSSVAFRMNAFSGIAIAALCAIGYAVAREFGARRSIALAATLWFAFTQDVWAHAARAEAQDLAIAVAALGIWCFLRWMRGGRERYFAGAFGLCGCALAVHPNALWVLPALAVGALVARRRASWRAAAAGFALLVLPLLLYLYLPLRSSEIVARGLDPTAALPGVNGGIFWNYNDPSTMHGLALELSGSQFQTPSYLLASLNPLRAGDALWAFLSGTHAQYGIVVTLLVVAGFLAAWRRDWRTTLLLCIACTAGLLFSVVYPNEGDVGRYRLLASWLAVPLLGALTPSAGGRRAQAAALLLLVVLAGGAAWAFAAQRGFLEHRANEGGRWVIDAVRGSVPPGSVVVTGWLDATSLAYGAYVDGSLPGRIIVSDNELRTPLYREWAVARPVFVLVDPHDVSTLPGARDAATLDAYHELYRVLPAYR